MVSASVSTGSWVTQKPDSRVAVFTAAGTDVVSGLSNWSLSFFSYRPLDCRLGSSLRLGPESPSFTGRRQEQQAGFKITLTLSRYQIYLETEMPYEITLEYSQEYF